MSYTAVLRWKGPDPALELETRHTGFAIPEDAAVTAWSVVLPQDVDGALLGEDPLKARRMDRGLRDRSRPRTAVSLSAPRADPRSERKGGMSLR